MNKIVTPKVVEDILERSAASLAHPLAIQGVNVTEEPGDGSDYWAIRFAADRPEDRRHWIETRINLTLMIRDALLELGDDRFPVIEVWSPDEWRTLAVT